MVNAPRMMQERRQININQITESIKKAIVEGKELNKKDLVMATMANLNLSRRTATEYVEVALYNLNNET